MSAVSSISVSTTPALATQPAHHGHHAHAKGASSTGSPSAAGKPGAASTATTANESLQQLADQGDPLAIAELKAEQPAQPKPGREPATATGSTHGAKEPGKGEEVDVYA